MKFLYVVYETTVNTMNNQHGLKMIGHPVAHYTNFCDMIADWSTDILFGTHIFFVLDDQTV